MSKRKQHAPEFKAKVAESRYLFRYCAVDPETRSNTFTEVPRKASVRATA